MDEQEYIEGLSKVIDPDTFDVHPTLCKSDKERADEGMAKAKQKAREITDWHREQGLRVVPYEPTKDIDKVWNNYAYSDDFGKQYMTKKNFEIALLALNAAKGGGDGQSM